MKIAVQTARPLIGVTTSEVRRGGRIPDTPRMATPRIEMALGLTYLEALEAAGAVPMVMPPMHPGAASQLLDRIDGLLLSGGPDLDPATYGAQPHPELGPIEPDLDRFELEVIKGADCREIPILAICRGMQALNVARGGTLHQHVPDLRGAASHRQPDPGEVPTHEVEIESESRLGRITGAPTIEVNSFHHQAVDDLGNDLAINASAPDGIVEGVEDPSRDYFIGVQWHAELLVYRAFEANLFASFVSASRRHFARADGRPPTAQPPLPAARSQTASQ